MPTATVVTKAAIQPVSLLWTPSSRSIISSARASASALTSLAGWCSRAISSLIAPPYKSKAPPAGWTGLWCFGASVADLYALLCEVLDGARVPGHRGGLGLLVLELDVLRFLVRADQVVTLVEDGLDDVIGGLVVHLLVRDEDVHHRRLLVVDRHALVGLLGDAVLDVEVAVLLVHRRHQLRVVDHLDRHAGRVGQVGHRRGGQSADPEKGVDLAVLQRVHGFGHAQALARHVAVLVQARRLDDAERHHLGGAAARAGGHALALEIGHFLDAAGGDRHHVHAVRVEHRQGAHGNRLAGELVLALVRVQRGVRHGERDVGLAGADELQVGDRAAGHLRSGLHAGHVLRERRGHAAAERVVHAAGAAGGDRQVLRLCRYGERGGSERSNAHELIHDVLLLAGVFVLERGNSNARRGASRPPPAGPATPRAPGNRGCRRGYPSPPAAVRSPARGTSTAIRDSGRPCPRPRSPPPRWFPAPQCRR